MLVCKIEMWPDGSEQRAREIGRVVICNVGGSADVGEYEVELLKSPEYAKRGGAWKRARVANFPRLRLGPYDLLYRALGFCVGYRNAGLPKGDLGDKPNREATE